jgi:hypothetical protein
LHSSFVALATFPPSNPRPEPWENWTPGTAQLLKSTSITTVMSYQFPLLSSGHAAMELPQHAYASEFNMQEGQSTSVDGRDHPRAPLAGPRDANLAPSRSISTPINEVRQDTTLEKQMASGAQGEKKRTKLGYHRTSIACSTHTRFLCWLLVLC